jgi:hypothetical protein
MEQTMNSGGWIRAEITILAIAIFIALNILTRLFKLNIHPLFLFLATLFCLFLMGISGDILAWIKRKPGNGSE